MATVANVVNIVVATRTTGAGAWSATTAAARNMATQVSGALTRLRTQFTATTRATHGLAGAYRSAGGQWRAANGQFLSTAQAAQATQLRSHLLGRTFLVLTGIGRVLGNAMGGLAGIVGKVGPAMASGAATASGYILALGGLLAVAVPLVAALVSLAGAVQLIAPAALAGVAIMGVFKMALSGVGDALKAGIEGDQKKYNQALKNLAPNAADAVRTIVKLRKEYAGLQKTVQNRFFAGASGEIYALNAAFKPLLDRILPRIADSLRWARTEFVEFLTLSGAKNQLEFILDKVALSIDNVMGLIRPFTQMFIDIAEVAAPRLERVTGSMKNAAEAASDWIRKMKESGRLGEWLDSALRNLDTLRLMAGDIGRALGAIWKAGDGGESMLQSIRNITKAFADWANSPDGQKILGTLSAIGTIIVTVLLPIVGFLASAWFSAFRMVLRVTLDTFSAIVTAAAHAFSWIPGLGPKLESAARAVAGFRDKVNAALDGIQDEDVNVRVRVIGGAKLNMAQQSGTYSSGIGGRAAGGPVSGWTWVGEQGAELIKAPPGSQVASAPDSQRMATQSAGAVPASGGDAWEIRSTGGELDALILAVLRRVVRRRGGNAQRVLGGAVA